jgi:hypothetical protein
VLALVNAEGARKRVVERAARISDEQPETETAIASVED